MAGGGLMQLVAYGAQDVYLSGNPQITFFKAVYKRHTNFSCEAITQTFSGSPDFGRRVTCPITRNGDLITKMYLVCKVTGSSTKKWAWTSQLGHAMIDNVELEVGGSRIDKQYGDWMNIWHSLTKSGGHDEAYARMVGDTSSMTSLAVAHADQTLYVPLQFFCCRNNGLALPLISLQYHDVRVNFEFSAASSLVSYVGTAPTVSMASCELLVDFVFLDSEERKRFAQSSHEYLIEQVQFTGAESVTSSSVKARLNFNHPCKALLWNVVSNNWQGKSYLYWSNNASELAEKTTVLKVLNNVTQAGAPAAGEMNSATGVVKASANNVYSHGGHEIVNIAGGDIDPAAFDLDNFVVTSASVTPGLASTHTPATQQANWAALNVTVNQHNNYGTALSGSGNPCTTGLLQLNGHDRFAERSGTYFNQVQPYQHFNNTPSDGVNCYSFAASPAEHQPSGSCNFSRIDNAQLVLGIDAGVATAGGKLNVYAINYNVLRVMSGMGGLAYSN
jgi:hypothetical protein